MKCGWIVLAALVWGCGSESTKGDPLGSGFGPCAQRQGTYSARYAERQGACGASPERIFIVDEQPTNASVVAEGCTGSVGYTDDNCEVTYDTSCPEDGLEKGGRISIRGTSKWNGDATYGTAVEQWIVARPNGSIVCISTYDVTLRRQ